MTLSSEKVKLRRTLLNARKALSVQEWQERSDRLCGHLQDSPLFQEATTILSYVSFRREPDLSSLRQDSTKTWGLPRCVGESLVWHRYQGGDALEPGAFGILEPHVGMAGIDPTAVDLILVPALACDHRGYRLGYGGGFYDRMLSLPPWQSVPTLGIVFEFAYLVTLPIEPWDQPVTGVCTDEQLVICP
ncbi:MAG: 5-formyltetrahydrofolate cyclo-ligase [Oscillatoriales cyanobacterium RM1_1_9]|nr:5-formyltetrahydrofolate cyclo-ligase [Oscillatoriales cyanobacterium SM2_3_0]NJO45864.1 5-formyltetrahydrofolate cyclo-ligase [Oscillatoriales cyanobacterium RM2_1_1]NJO71308.1 5-formyltetrahydrofolate cyclo-ligase [Oscillatoriales cyanobacterium RM1_1_9]